MNRKLASALLIVTGILLLFAAFAPVILDGERMSVPFLGASPVFLILGAVTARKRRAAAS